MCKGVSEIKKKTLDKKAIERLEPNWICHALVTREQVQELETTELINKMYNGAADQLVASVLGSKRLTEQEIERLKRFVNQLK